MMRLHLVLLFAFISLIFACQEESEIKESAKTIVNTTPQKSPSSPIEDSLTLDPENFAPCGFDPIEDIIPEGMKLIRSFNIDLDSNSIDEVLIHCLSDKRVECELLEDSNCFMDVLLLVETEPEWHILKQYDVPKPPSDADHEINLIVDSNKSVVLRFNYAPVNPSNVTTTQFYSFSRNELLLDSIIHSVGTKMGPDLMSWNYKFNMVQKELRFQSQETLSVFDDNEEGAIVKKIDTTLTLNINKVILISQPISIENLIPEGIEEPYF